MTATADPPLAAAAPATAPRREPVVLEMTGEAVGVGPLLRDLGRNLGLMRMFAVRDYSARYRSASLGLLWAVALPLLQGLVIAVVFSRIVGGGNNKVYVASVIAGMSAWSYASTSFSQGSTTIVDGGALAGKVYFPRLILAAVPACSNLVSFGISLLLAELVALSLGSGLHLSLLLLPVAVALAWALAVFASAVSSLLHVYFRDVRYTVQAMVLVLFYATPVIFSLKGVGARTIPAAFVPISLANPFTGLVELTRAALLGPAHAPYVWTSSLITLGWVLVLGVATVLAYARYERIACDRL